jgi:hypothetical protein
MATRTSSSEKLKHPNQPDVNALKDQNKKTKDSDHKNENAANAKANTGHYKSAKGK